MSDEENKNKKRKKRNSQCNNEENNKSEENQGLASLSYAEYIILASTLAYSLQEELSQSDLAILITFLYVLLADLQLLITQNQITQNASTGKNKSSDEDTDEDTEDVIAIRPGGGRSSKNRRYKAKSKRKKYN